MPSYVNDNFNAIVDETISIVTENLETIFVTVKDKTNSMTIGAIYSLKEFESIMLTNGFLPLISIHTHEKPGCNKLCIDNVFTNSINDYILQVQSVKAYHTSSYFFYI